MKIILAPIGVAALAGTTVAHTLRYHGSKQTIDGGGIKSSFDAILHGSLTTTNAHAEMSPANPSEPRSLASGYNCIGNKLMGGSSIGREEFVCSRDGMYRFGLDENGVLGEWHGNELNWSPPGLSGSRLYMQNQDGNLVLRDGSGQALWAINCGYSPNAFLYAKHGGSGGIRVLSESGKDIIWRTWYSGTEPTCFPKSTVDPGDLGGFNCISETLNADIAALFKNQFICSPAMTFAFGLDKDGMLGQWRNGKLHWSPGVKGHRLQMQGGDGNLVLYEEDGSAVWATNCGLFPGAFLTASGSVLVQYTTKWGDAIFTAIWKTVKSSGSTCFPGYNEPARCVGSRLDKDRRSLGRGEYICSNSGNMFGLNQDGLLGFWNPTSQFLSQSLEGILLWSPGVYGSRLYMQYGDGNLVLRDSQGNPVWSSGCKAPPGEHFYLLATNLDGVQILDKGQNVIWEVWANNYWSQMSSQGIESECNPPKDERPQTKCKTLNEVGSVLRRNEYVCDYDDDRNYIVFLDSDHRFGLNNRGQLVVWEGRKTIWTWGDLFGGDKLVLNSDNLRVYAADGTIMWTSCPISDGKVDMAANSVQLVDSGGVAWFIDYDSGFPSTCNPANVPQYDCPVSVQYDCHVNVIDHFNLRNVQMGLQRSYYQFDIWGYNGCSGIGWNDFGPGAIIMSGFLGTDSISLTDDHVQYTLSTSCKDVSTNYVMQNDEQFEFVEGFPSACSDFSKSLIYYGIKKNMHPLWEGKALPG